MEFFTINLVLYAFVSYAITYFIGHVTIAFFKIPEEYPFFKEFSKLVIASFVIITGYSIYITNGITINAGNFFLALFFLAWCKKNNYLCTRDEIYNAIFNRRFLVYFLLQLILLLIAFIFLLYKIKSSSTGEIYEVYGDFYNYSKIIQHLNTTGIEALFVDLYSGIPSDRVLYHFGELWQSAFYSTITNQTPFAAFYFQLFPIYLVIYVIGCCSLIEIFIKPQNKISYALSGLIIITCGISFYIPTNTIFTKGDWWNMSLVFQPKYFFPAIFIIYAILLTQLNKIFPLLLISVACIFACNVIAPGVLLFMGFVLLCLFISKQINLSEFIKYALIPIFAVVFIGVYYLIINYLNNKNAITANVVSTTTYVFSWLEYLQTAFNCFAGQLIKSILSWLFYILAFFSICITDPKKQKSLQKAFIVIVIIHIASLMSYALFHDMVDAVQLWSNIYLPLSSIICFMVIVYLMSNTKRALSFIAIILIVLCFMQAKIFHRHSIINQEYINQVLQKYDGSVSVFYKSEKDFTSIFSKNVTLYAPSPFLIMKYKKFNPVCLTVFDIPKSKEKLLYVSEENLIRNSVFYKFVQLQKRNQKFISIEQSQLDFIEKYKVKYAFTYLNASLPDTLQSLVITSVKDSMNGITFYQLR